jgi:hypothetical protein
MYIYVYVCVCVYIYIHTHTHACAYLLGHSLHTNLGLLDGGSPLLVLCVCVCQYQAEYVCQILCMVGTYMHTHVLNGHGSLTLPMWVFGSLTLPMWVFVLDIYVY